MDVVLVGCVKFSCIQPYLVNQLVATFHSLGVQVLFFVVRCIVRIWVRIGICVLVCQFFVIINELVACDIEFLFRKNVFLWLELRFFRRSYTIVELFISCICYVRNDCFGCSIVRYHNFNSRNHCVVFDCYVCSSYFLYSIVISLTKIVFTKFKSLEGNFTSSVILHCFDNIAIFLKNECEFLILQLTTFKRFREFKIKWNWNVVHTFLSRFFWSFNLLSSWVVVVDYLSRSIFNICTSFNCLFNCCWDIKFVVTSKFKFSCVDNLSIFCVSK